MSDPLNNLTDTFLDFYRLHALAVFRYHLVRTGDWQDAEAMTVATFKRTQAWFARRLTANGEAKTWLYRTAVSLYSRFRRPSGHSRPDEVLASPTQEQLSQFALIADLHDQWRRLPRKEQDARALYLFAGLEMEEISTVTGWKLQELFERIGHLAVDQGELRLLAGQLQPVGYFLGHLENDLRQSAAALSGRGVRLGSAKWLWLRYRAGPFLTVIGQALPLVVLAGLLFWVVNSYNQQLAPAEPEAQPTRASRRVRNTPQPRNAVPPSQDSAVLIDAHGAVYLYNFGGTSLSRMIRLSEDGFYSRKPVNPDFLPQISPDGTWLSLVRPLDGSTWLFSLNGTQRRQISASSLQLTWSPGGGEAVYPLPDDPRVLYQYSAAAIYNRELARFPGDIKAVAWSPDGRLIGVAFQTPGSVPDTIITYLSVMPSRGGERIVIASLQEHMPTSESQYRLPIRPLLWTDDSQELWYPSWNAAVNIDRVIVADNTATRFDIPADQNLNVPLMPLISMPFNDRYGVQTKLLYGAHSVDLPWMDRSIAVSADRRQIALLLANPNGVVGSVALLDDNLDRNRWIVSLGRLGKLSWTAEGRSLVASEYADRPGLVYQINTRNGDSYNIAEGYWLLGTVSELRNDAGNHAPQAAKIPLTGPDMSGPTVRVRQPGLGLSIEVPAHFRVWQNSVNDPYGSLMVSNFDLADPLGYLSLNADDFLLNVGRIGSPGTQIGESLAGIGTNPDKVDLEPFMIGDHQAYRLVNHFSAGIDEVDVYVEDPEGPIILSFLPGDSSKKELFNRIISSLQFDLPPTPTPTPLPTPTVTPTVEIAWNRYVSPTMGIAFDLPSNYLTDPVCGAREDGRLLQIASQVYVSSDRLSGIPLSEYVDQRLAHSGQDLNITTRESADLPAGEAITVEGSLGVVGFFSQTYIRSGDRVLLIGLTPNQSCSNAIAPVSDLQVYRRMVATIRVIQ